MGMRQKQIEKKIKKTEFFKTNNSQFFFAEITGIGPWVSRINQYEEHLFCSTYIAVQCNHIA